MENKGVRESEDALGAPTISQNPQSDSQVPVSDLRGPQRLLRSEKVITGDWEKHERARVRVQEKLKAILDAEERGEALVMRNYYNIPSELDSDPWDADN